MEAKKEAPLTGGAANSAKVIHTTEQDSRKWADGQEVIFRTTLGLLQDIREKYIDDWKRLYDERENEYSFFRILAVAYETGRENGIRQERARRKRRLV